ncbi:MAG: hypothetical protein H0W74_06585 [Sphingosinicella sp.]|nr:hypothetical protein [Sphingosinicella sp.]
MNRQIVLVTGLAVSLAGCSSRPRQFAPEMKVAVSDPAKYAADYETCRTLVANGQRSGFAGQVASGGAGVAAGVGAGAVVMGGTGGTLAGAAAAASAAMVMMPIVGIAAAWGLAKNRRLKKEKEIKQATALCLSEAGYMVTGWERDKHQKPIKVPKKKAAEPSPAA